MIPHMYLLIGLPNVDYVFFVRLCQNTQIVKNQLRISCCPEKQDEHLHTECRQCIVNFAEIVFGHRLSYMWVPQGALLFHSYTLTF